MKTVRSIRRQAGFTMVEVLLVSGFILAGLAAVGSLVGSAQDLTDDTRTHTRAVSEHRKNLRALSNLLRNVDITTLGGFDDEGTAAAPSFQRVAGVDLEDRSYLASERLEWRPISDTIWGVQQPGHIHLVTAGGTEVIARNVPAGGFVLRQEGATLAIQLTTFYTLGDRRTHQVTSETAVSLRN